MKPLINPWGFYFISFCSSARLIIGCAIFLLVIWTLFYSFWFASNNAYGALEDFRVANGKKFIKKMILVTIAASLLLVVVPSEDTAVNNYGKELVDYIFEKIYQYQQDR